MKRIRKCPRCKQHTLVCTFSVSLMPHGYEEEVIRKCECGYFKRVVNSL